MGRVEDRDQAAAGGVGGGGTGDHGGTGGTGDHGGTGGTGDHGGTGSTGGTGGAVGEAGMPAEEVLAVVDWLEARGAVHVITGGWAVDALVGRATRPHRDLDVIVEAGACDALVQWLRGRGYEVVVDWLPIRVELRRGRCGVDLHPMEVDGRGDGVQAGFGTQVFEHRAADRTRGRIGGRRVVVATAARLMELHRGYEPRPEDLHDIALLRRLLQSDEPTGGDGEPAE